jgi:ribonucleoside-diphosphate reductase alpha subunit
VSASSIFRNIIIRQIEGGTPYVTSKDSINRKTNQNDTTHQCSNLCVEINEVVSDKETAVCNLANLNLPRFFDPDATDKDLPINWDVMEKVIRIAVTNLNRLIDVSFYPIKKAEYSNKKRRPMGLGVQGMADLHVLCGFPYDSPQAEHLEFKLLEFMYMIALDQSAELAKLHGTYENYAENRISKGLLQHDLWLQEYNESVNSKKTNPLPYPLHPRWDAVRAKIAEFGQRNSLLIALMPTASTYMITGSSPCFEPFNGMVYKRRAKSGEIIIVNKSLIRKLQSMGIWSPKIKNDILASRTGSIAEITEIPAEIRALYKTVWDISPKVTASRAILRGVFVDQSQSLNLFIASPSIKVLSQYHLYQFSRSAKTYSYYTRSLSSTDANKIEAQTEPTASAVTTGNTAKQVVCTDDVCVVCQ